MNVPSPMSGCSCRSRPPVSVASPVSTRCTFHGSTLLFERRDLAVLQRDRHVLADRVVVQEVALDLIALVAERQHELVEAVARVVLHDVPQDRPAADLDERLRTHLGLLGQARARAAAQDTTGNPFVSHAKYLVYQSTVARRPVVERERGRQPSIRRALAASRY